MWKSNLNQNLKTKYYATYVSEQSVMKEENKAEVVTDLDGVKDGAVVLKMVGSLVLKSEQGVVGVVKLGPC